MDTLRLLFVCSANICRSPTAEGILRYKARLLGLGNMIECDSAGTLAIRQGEAPSPRAIRRAALRGYDLRDLRSRPVCLQDFNRFHLILAMDRNHVRSLRRMAPSGSGAQIRLFLDYALTTHGPREVPDPYNGGVEDYDYALDLIEAGVDGLLQAVTHNLAASG